MKELFYNRQKDLLWIANSSVGKKLLGYELEYPIVQIFPHAYRISVDSISINKKQHTVLTDRFFTYSRIAELFLPILEKLDIYRETAGSIEKPHEALLHYSNLELNYKYPQIHLVTSTFSPNIDGSGTGRLASSNASFATARTGSGVTKADSIAQLLNWLNAGTYTLDRIYHPFVTSTLPDDATKTSAFIRYVGSAGTEDTDSFALNVVQSTQANMASLATSDWGNIGSTSFGSITAASWNASGNNDVALDSNGLSNISLTGTSGFAGRGNRDFNNAAPTNHNTLGIQSSSVMVLSVTYTIPEVGGFYYMSV